MLMSATRLFFVFLILCMVQAWAGDTKTTSSLGQFAGETPAEKELERMLDGPDDKIDLALANYLIAKDIPAYCDLSREDFMHQIEQYCTQAATFIENCRRNPNIAGPLSDPYNLMFAFCSGVVHIKFSYAEEFRDPNMSRETCRRMYQNPDNVFLAGLLRNKQGCCVSMPLIYVVMAQRLDYPVRLVTIGQHYFVRWDQPHFKMDIVTCPPKN